MSALNHFLKNILTALLATVWFSIPCFAVEQARLERLYSELQEAEAEQAVKIGNEIVLELSKSGSSAMDLLLKRGRDALEAGENRTAIEHLTALTDHAPDFAEGWHLRAVAFTRAGLYGPAIDDLERALALRPRHFEAIYGLGVVLEELDRPNMAYEAYERAAEIHPHYRDLAEVLERLGESLDGEDL
ncbi:tetratricopeptide repeat protein [Roseovarius aestuarii]|uniref:Tetratricopeptide repeat protein n=1 Tax=Roseovarius aestuarii TaxID=475083 RepID=A0A1X7BLZ2_9RHOB|nr:tetratricopeptide repeat protein [Roseovarius aestuarii]SMC10279.1 Tetratricopeptide repeat protein [Roseovarius aestuarii]